MRIEYKHKNRWTFLSIYETGMLDCHGLRNHPPEYSLSIIEKTSRKVIYAGVFYGIGWHTSGYNQAKKYAKRYFPEAFKKKNQKK